MDRQNTAAQVPLVITDINNVMCLGRPYGGRDAFAALAGAQLVPGDVFSRLFTPEAKSVLRQVHAALSGAVEYVISSTWRREFTRSQLCEVFVRAELAFIAEGMRDGDEWCTPLLAHESERLEEVEAWLGRNPTPRPLVVLDDDYSGPSLKAAAEQADHPLNGRVLLCQRGVGLRERHAEFIVETLRTPVEASARRQAAS